MKNLQKINKIHIKSMTEILSYVFIMACYIVGFFPWLGWIKYHVHNNQIIMVIIDILLFFIIVPINGFIIIIKTIFGLLF